MIKDITGKFINVKITDCKTWYFNGEIILQNFNNYSKLSNFQILHTLYIYVEGI